MEAVLLDQAGEPKSPCSIDSMPRVRQIPRCRSVASSSTTRSTDRRRPSSTTGERSTGHSMFRTCTWASATSRSPATRRLATPSPKTGGSSSMTTASHRWTGCPSSSTLRPPPALTSCAEVSGTSQPTARRAGSMRRAARPVADPAHPQGARKPTPSRPPPRPRHTARLVPTETRRGGVLRRPPLRPIGRPARAAPGSSRRRPGRATHRRPRRPHCERTGGTGLCVTVRDVPAAVGASIRPSLRVGRAAVVAPPDAPVARADPTGPVGRVRPSGLRWWHAGPRGPATSDPCPTRPSASGAR